MTVDRSGADDGRGCRAYRAGRECECCKPGLLSQHRMESHAVECVYCAGRGCGECGGTGQRYTHLIREGDASAIVHGSAPLDDQAAEAIRAVVRAARERMASEGS